MLGGKRPCPICNSKIDTTTKICPSCHTDLTIFDVDLRMGVNAASAKAKTDRSLDELLASLIDDEKMKKELLKEISTEKKGDQSAGASKRDIFNLDILEEPPKREPPTSDLIKRRTPVERIETPLERPDTAPPQREERHQILKFECPVCSAEVDEHAPKCPGCGAVFSEGQQFQCPICNSSVPVESIQCPSCGVRFTEDTAHAGLLRATSPILEKKEEARPSQVPISEGPTTRSTSTLLDRRAIGHQDLLSLRRGPGGMEKDIQWRRPEIPPSRELSLPGEEGLIERIMGLHRSRVRDSRPQASNDPKVLQNELTRLVGQLKALVDLGKRFNMEHSGASNVIAQATQFAKQRNFERAVALAWEGRVKLEESYLLQAARKLEDVQGELNKVKEPGSSQPIAEALVKEAIKDLEKGDIESGMQKVQMARDEIATRAVGYSQSRKAIESARALIQQAKSFDLDVTAADDLLRRSEQALARGDAETAGLLANQSEDKAKNVVKEGIRAEIRKAKDAVLDLKMKGVDLRWPMELLKLASDSIKENNYTEAIKQLKVFKKEFSKK